MRQPHKRCLARLSSGFEPPTVLRNGIIRLDRRFDAMEPVMDLEVWQRNQLHSAMSWRKG